MWLALVIVLLAGGLGMDDILRRLARLEDGQVAAARQLDALDAEAVRSRRFRDAQASGDLLRRLDPGPLDGSFGLRGAPAERPPELGTPLLSRLRADASMATTAGRVDPTGEFGNVLGDPTFATVPFNGYTLTAASANISDANPQWPYWNAWYVLNSGTAPATSRTFSRDYERWALGPGLWTTNVTSSSMCTLDLTWGAAAGDITVYLLANDYAFIGNAIPSWITAGVDLALTAATPTANITSATAYVEIVNGVGTVLAQSDPEDILALEGVDLRSHLETALQDPAASTAYYWRLRVDVVFPASAGHIYLDVSQPNLAWSEDGSLPQFTPAVGRWIPETQRYHGARAYRTAVLSVSDSTDTAVTFPTGSATESWDTDLIHDMGTDTARFYAPFDGYYQINAGVGFAGNATGYRDVWIEANADGVKRARSRELNLVATDLYVTTSVLLRLAEGEYVRLMVWQNSGGALNVLGNERDTFLDFSLVGV